MKRMYQITREALRKKDFKAGTVKLTSTSKEMKRIDLLAPVLKDLIIKK